MKYLVTAILISISAAASAQSKHNTSTDIHDDGNTLKLTYKGTVNDKYIDYETRFNVKGWNQKEKEMHIRHLKDSVINAPSTENKSSSIKKSIKISDNGNQLSLTIDYKSSSQNINYTNIYDVRGKTQGEKDAIVKKVLDGLSVK